MRECTITDLVAAHASGATVIDVRQPEEYSDGHVPGALLIPLGQIGSRMDEVPKGGAVYVICASGNRSKSAADLLEQAGYESYSVRGGTMGWLHAGHPVVTGPAPA